MPKRNWIYVAATVGLVVAIAGSGIWVYYLDNPITSQANASKDQRATQPILRPAERIARSLEAIESSQNSQDNEDRARRELDAQEGAWRWAKWVAWLTGVQAVLSGVGIVFLVQSLRQVEAGLSHSHAADAAHFIVRDAMVKRGNRWCVSINNHGQTIGFALAYTIEAVDRLPSLKKWRADENAFVPLVAPVEAGSDLIEAAFVANVPANAGYIIGKIDYVDVFGVRHLSGFRYDRTGKSWRVHRLNDWCFMRRKRDQSAKDM